MPNIPTQYSNIESITKITPITLNDSTVYDGGTNGLPSRAIISDTAGTLVCRAQEDTADRTLTLLAGVVYPFSLKMAKLTGSSVTGLKFLN